MILVLFRQNSPRILGPSQFIAFAKTFSHHFAMLTAILIGLTSPLNASEEETKKEASTATANGLLIFLDDSEFELAATNQELISAIEAENGPILVSAWLLDLLDQEKPYENTSPQDLAEKYKAVLEEEAKSLFSGIKRRAQEIADLKFTLVDFGTKKGEKWVIKEVNPSLYLLLPKKYLQEKNVSVTDTEKFSAEGPITQTEQSLGLKINHMKTVIINDIKKPEPAPQFADYFIQALSSIFVTNAEYQEKNKIPAWAIYLTGHGLINDSIAHLSFDQFKNFLTFLETKITTKVFVYRSCYAAGTNSVIIYKDAEKGIDKTYPFTIITTNLTDSPSVTALKVEVEVKEGILQPKFTHNFTEFLKKITSPDISQYRDAIASITASLTQNIAQIKYPGIPWFSILDSSKVAIIDSIMAKTRTAPLDIATFFAKKGQAAEPEAILLTASTIPFEIIINTKTTPAIVSMIPGDATHRIKKISSKTKTFADILNSFDISGLNPTKIFIIDEVVAGKDILQDVVIVLQLGSQKKYFTYQGKRYAVFGAVRTFESAFMPPAEADDADQKKYETYLKRYAPKAKILGTLPMSELQPKADKIFSQEISVAEAEKEITGLLDAMPDNSLLRIKLITGEPCPGRHFSDFDIYNCWDSDMLKDLSYYKSSGTHKIIVIDTIKICTESGKCYEMSNVIIDATKKETRIFLRSPSFKDPVQIKNDSARLLNEDYMPAYQKMFDYYEQHKTFAEEIEKEIGAIEKRSVHQLLTPEAISKIRAAAEKKQAERKKGAPAS